MTKKRFDIFPSYPKLANRRSHFQACFLQRIRSEKIKMKDLNSQLFCHFCLAVLTLSLGLIPGAHARVYQIKKGDHFAQGTFNVNQWFMGERLEFLAQFNSSNIYTLPPGDQADSNKLFGFSDCGRYAGNSSARIGWRWFRNQLEITAVAHYEGTWHLYEILGTATLGQIHHFEIALSPDRHHYRFRFDHGPPIEMKRDCGQSVMWGYVLYPYFGGNLPAPRDMNLSVWSESRSGILLLQAGPNPASPGQTLKTRIFAPETIEARYELINTSGVLEWSSAPVLYTGMTEPSEDHLILPTGLRPGVHLLRLSTRAQNGWVPGFMLDGEEAIRILTLPKGP
jgi:hypothetical protein